jgi:D-alanyl-D-alanine carboxypeptidase (penicillin-binding protein 5/6)
MHYGTRPLANSAKPKKRRTHLKTRITALLFLAVIIGYLGIATIRTPALTLEPTLSTVTAAQTTPEGPLNWPAYGQAAVGAINYGVLDTNGAQTPVPTASTAKIMTAYAILRAKPLALGNYTSPMITLTQTDVDIYNQCVVMDCSVALVQAGEQISEYQALQAILLPSANNMAKSLAIWAFGSMEAYLAYANNLAEEMGLNQTHFADASGYAPETVSTANDLVKLSIEAMKHPVFREIVGQESAVIPVAGKIYNVNGLLGRDNLIGLKTGNTEQAGGVFVAAATHEVSGQTITVITAVMGGPTLVRSMLDSMPLINSAKQNFTLETVLPKGSTVGYYSAPWLDDQVALKTSADVSLVKWRGSAVITGSDIQSIKAPTTTNTKVGTVTVTSIGNRASTDVVTSKPITPPSLAWRVRHPF